MIRRVLLVLTSAAALVVVVGILSAGRACAHDPRFACSPRDASNPIVIADPTKSWAFYGRLGPDQHDFYRVETPTAQRIPVTILLDVRDADNPSRPEATLYDEAGKTLAKVDLSNSTPFYEPFSRVHYLSSPDRTLNFPPGIFTVEIGMHGGTRSQRYTFAFGRDERFSLLEMPYLVGAIYRIHAQKY